MEGLREAIEEKEDLESEARISSLALPTKEAVDKILQYETTIERHLYRAMNQLERLQGGEKGKPSPHQSA